MDEPVDLPLSEVIGALSYALDATDGQPAGHALRTCMIGMQLVQRLGLDPDTQAAAFYGLLMKDAAARRTRRRCLLSTAPTRSH